ncbi:hypothetical protein [Planktothricoides raciborskii]|nr:hypothetical protein [Planktothricoides raciborskii]
MSAGGIKATVGAIRDRPRRRESPLQLVGLNQARATFYERLIVR